MTTTNDTGAGSLRACLTSPAPGTTVTFDRAVFKPHEPAQIALVTELPDIRSGDVTIDASDAGVILDGAAIPVPAGLASVGLSVVGVRGVHIRGLVVRGFTIGIALGLGAQQCTIGQAESGWMREKGANSLYGNEAGVGVFTEGTTSNHVVGNIVGLDHDGRIPASTQYTGIGIEAGATGNRIDGNLVSGNEFGIKIADEESRHNVVLRNWIGLGLDGAPPARPQPVGVILQNGARENAIGGSRDREGNVITGNQWGVEIIGAGTQANVVSGNRIGITPDGRRAVAADNAAITIGEGAADNRIGGSTANLGNIIAGHRFGIGILSPGSDRNLILHNNLGADGVTIQAAGESMSAIDISGGAASNIIGQAGAGNTIVGYDFGVSLAAAGTSNNTVMANLIGFTSESASVTGNEQIGVRITESATGNLIGGNRPGQGNVIGGSEVGIAISGGGNGTRIRGNRIGTDPSGREAAGNLHGIIISGSQDNIVGGEEPGDGNVVSGNDVAGISIGIDGAERNAVLGNLIGTTMDGDAPLPNGANGIEIGSSAKSNRIGSATAPNTISGNGRVGVLIAGTGVSGNIVQGNRIGLSLQGDRAIRNEVGLQIGLGATQNIVGGTEAGEGNWISGNNPGLAVAIDGVGTAENSVTGNRIGFTVRDERDSTAGNQGGIVVRLGASNNVVAGNFVGHTKAIAILVTGSGSAATGTTTGNRIERNVVGEGPSGNAAPNYAGIIFSTGSHGNIAGGESPASGNVVAHHPTAGIGWLDASSVPNPVRFNRVYDNEVNLYYEVPIAGVPRPPILTAYTEAGAREIRGTACAGCDVEVFANPTADTSLTNFVGLTVAGDDGTFRLRFRSGHALLAANPHVTAFARIRTGLASIVSDPLTIDPRAEFSAAYLPLMLRAASW